MAGLTGQGIRWWPCMLTCLSLLGGAPELSHGQATSPSDSCSLSDDGWWAGFGIPGLAGAGCAKEYGTAHAFTIYHDRLIVVGDFAWAGGEPAVDVAQWDGASWSPLDLGNSGYARTAIVYDDCLIVGGPFGYRGTEPANCIARWDGT
ncbi:MAG: hypothetical protein KAY32_14415 [Candidatus Eisenbacteria sp.]|nr:hypothetical protein [Candidatus Eisenbacteria bacterium]